MTDVKYYRQILEDQTNFLNINIEKYSKILDEEIVNLSESVVGQIRLVIGQSRLFINERFKQFSGLVDDCEWKRGEKEIKVEDLAGFWDMINYQIDDLKSKFTELEQLQSNDWKPIVENNIENKPVNKNIAAKKIINGSCGSGNCVGVGNIDVSYSKINGHNHYSQNGKDSIDSSVGINTNHHNKQQQVKKKTNVKSNFREFLKAKKQEMNANTINNNNITSNKNGHHTNDNNNDDNIQIMMVVNNNNNNNNNDHDHDVDYHNVMKNGHLTKEIKSELNYSNDKHLKSTTTAAVVVKDNNNVISNNNNNKSNIDNNDNNNEHEQISSNELDSNGKNQNSIHVFVN